jgi:TctA family transporter
MKLYLGLLSMLVCAFSIIVLFFKLMSKIEWICIYIVKMILNFGNYLYINVYIALVVTFVFGVLAYIILEKELD